VVRKSVFTVPSLTRAASRLRASRTARSLRAPREARPAGSTSRRSRSRRVRSTPTPAVRDSGRAERLQRRVEKHEVHRVTVASKRVDLRSDTLTKPSARCSRQCGRRGRRRTVPRRIRRSMSCSAGWRSCSGKRRRSFFRQQRWRTRSRCVHRASPGSIVLAEERTHILIYEWGGPAIHSGLVMRGVTAEAGRVTPDTSTQSKSSARAASFVLENTHRSSGGRIWPLDEFLAAVDAAHERGALVHLDGARLFNAAVVRGFRRRRGPSTRTRSPSASRRGSLPARRSGRGVGRLHRARMGGQVPLWRRDAAGRCDRCSGALRDRPQRRSARGRPCPCAPLG